MVIPRAKTNILWDSFQRHACGRSATRGHGPVRGTYLSIGQSTSVCCKSFIATVARFGLTHADLQQRDLLSRCVLAAAFGLGFVVESPAALVLVGTAGVCSLAHQLAIATLDLHVISDVWMYHDPQAISRLLSVRQSFEFPRLLCTDSAFYCRFRKLLKNLRKSRNEPTRSVCTLLDCFISRQRLWQPIDTRSILEALLSW